MSSDPENRMYPSVLRAVLWGTAREEIFEMLQVNGITGELAEEMFRRARAERIALLRSEAIGKAVKGALVLGAGVTLFCSFWFGSHVITRNVFVTSGLMSAWGLWKTVDGTVDAILAPSKKGPVELGEE